MRVSLVALVAVAAALAAGPTASGQTLRYCVKPDNAGAFLSASAGVSCSLANRVIHAIFSNCSKRDRCLALGFHCVSAWAGDYDQRFSLTAHALCNSGWRWIEWDGG